VPLEPTKAATHKGAVLTRAVYGVAGCASGFWHAAICQKTRCEKGLDGNATVKTAFKAQTAFKALFPVWANPGRRPLEPLRDGPVEKGLARRPRRQGPHETAASRRALLRRGLFDALIHLSDGPQLFLRPFALGFQSRVSRPDCLNRASDLRSSCRASCGDGAVLGGRSATFVFERRCPERTAGHFSHGSREGWCLQREKLEPCRVLRATFLTLCHPSQGPCRGRRLTLSRPRSRGKRMPRRQESERPRQSGAVSRGLANKASPMEPRRGHVATGTLSQRRRKRQGMGASSWRIRIGGGCQRRRKRCLTKTSVEIWELRRGLFREAADGTLSDGTAQNASSRGDCLFLGSHASRF